MSTLVNTEWTVNEKIILLTNIIQGAVVDVPSWLIRAMADTTIQPRWDEIALPAGRSVSACRKMYEDMRTRAFSSMSFQASAPSFLGPSQAHGRTVSEHELQPPLHRSIQPRPARTTDSPMPITTNGEAFTILRPFVPELGPERRRKRGRPTKEEVEERDRRLAAVGQTYEPKKRSAKRPRPSGTPGSLSEPPTGTSPRLETPLTQPVQAREETSSSRRRSRRQHEEATYSTRQEPAGSPPPEDSGNERSSGAAQSPSDRLLLRSNERAQAVAAVARDIQQAHSPSIEHDPEQRSDDQPSGPPSI
ncbi:hypothetical protein LTR10_020963 [Elasticomyces elasticus]|uniref:Myb-like domain-containing protein n=1 Tax=Exophiala sideris TaxID=1016849 RepID=A0ABR0J983_9EURO|nr:hypothetical protein LTR10_020963 [Elasticomyces elasticus]KAK5027929.1 hypothetical protein LTS07_006805 [Exophiala sideris]KAK5037480.1 hypothetical protein LTR13_004637 [Exophiala sideris]KAK5059141.1 hypothetical protein LTR69_006430 [Exophiala sideris]KAK5182975.1 hypothetical protein LTR44_004685 [Eurotiomycetes sp. CCFEE 6388]